jgi:uncharacterized protein RhaS with RHS repeats
MRPIGFADRDRRRNSWVSLWKYRSSGRLLCKQGKRGEARAMLAAIYAWLTEAFGAVDRQRRTSAAGPVDQLQT